ncbi:MAG: transposase [Verrucomicrobiota bacterium]
MSGKRQWSGAPNRKAESRGYRGWNERGFLPHRDEPGLTQFVTFRLIDSFPAALRSEWEALFLIESDRERRRQLEAYLDKGHGACLLRRSDVAQVVEESLRFRHGSPYELRAWVIMPNHVHVLFKTGEMPMSTIVHGWKDFTAHAINKLLRRRGALWQEDYWDTYMRDAAHELKSRRYIESNPTKAKLVLDPKAWPWTSARHRDAHGALHL